MKEERQIARVATDYFSNLFTAQQQTNEAMLDAIKPQTIDNTASMFLATPYTEEEVLAALCKMHPSKAPRPAGLSAGFNQKFWNQVKLEVVNFCLNVLNCGASVQEVNQTNIVLILK